MFRKFGNTNLNMNLIVKIECDCVRSLAGQINSYQYKFYAVNSSHPMYSTGSEEEYKQVKDYLDLVGVVY